MSLNERIEHTLLRPTATSGELKAVCREAMDHDFAGVCVPPYAVPVARTILGESSVALVTVIGFPLGYQSTAVRAAEARKALEDEADELDVVMNLSTFKSGERAAVLNDLSTLASIAHQRDALLKVIVETAYLDADELRTACDLCVEAEVDFVKTSTGFAPHGARVEDVEQMRAWLPERMRIKASGGIKTREQAEAMVAAGADRLGTSSGIALLS